MAFIKAHNEYNIPIHDVRREPKEFDILLINEQYRPKGTVIQYHGYDVPEYNLRRLDTYQYYFQHTKIDRVEKDIDMLAAYTAFPHSSRQHYIGFVPNILRSNFEKTVINFSTHGPTEGPDMAFTRPVYLDYLNRSKYTYVLPAYTRKIFSIYRFIETLAYCFTIDKSAVIYS